MLFNELLIVLLVFLFAISIYGALAHLSSCPHLTILDVPKILRPVQQQRLTRLLDSPAEQVVRKLFSRQKFRETQLLQLYETREYLLRMSHNAFVFIIWANTELWRETKLRPGMEDRELFIQLSRNLHAAAVTFRLYALFTLVRIAFWTIFRTRLWSPLPAPRLTDLREVAGLRFYASYQQVREAVGALCLTYGQEFYEEIMAVI
jgi:hypothetical protein